MACCMFLSSNTCGCVHVQEDEFESKEQLEEFILNLQHTKVTHRLH